MKFLGYEILQTGDKKIPFKWENRGFWGPFILGLPNIITFIAKTKIGNIFYKTPWGIAIMHQTWNQYRCSPLFSYRYNELGINYAVESLSIKEFNFFKRQVWNDEEFMTVLFWHPWEVRDELLESDTFWKKKWSQALEQK